MATRLRWVRMAPLERPVVPPVYCRRATSSTWMVRGSFGGALEDRPNSFVKDLKRASSGHGTQVLFLRDLSLNNHLRGMGK